MYVRLGFAVAAHLDPDVLIVDEVLAVGDAEFRKKALGKMKDVSEGQGRTILFVSHNMDAIESLCEKTILLDKGSLIVRGESADVVLRYYERISNETFDATTGLSDRKRRRGDGRARFTAIKLTDEMGKERFSFTIGEIVQFRLKFRVITDVRNLSLCVALQTFKFRETIVSFRHVLSTSPLRSGYEREVAIQVPTGNLEPQTASLYFWLGQDGVKGQCDVVDGLSSPLKIVSPNKVEGDGLIRISSKLVS
jgi:lipopolysaccharide transport system ATP-binding protein